MPPNPQDQELLRRLREHRQWHRVRRTPSHQHELPSLTIGQRVADRVAATVGSWTFILFQSGMIAAWIAWNTGRGDAFDPYPYILLNLVLSFQAAYTAPAIMMSQNRMAETDRRHAENDYEVNVKAELEIELLNDKVDRLLALLDEKRP